MAEYDNTNRGSIWKNDKKEKDTQPDFTGSLDVEGVQYFVDAWKRKDGASDRAPPLSFKVKRKDKQPNGDRVPLQSRDPISTGRPSGRDDMDDEIPFEMEWRG